MKSLVSFFMFLLLSACAHAQQAPSTSGKAAIRVVIESFHSVLANRDKPTYLSLFLQGNVSWQSVMDAFQLSRERRKNPGAKRAQVEPGNTYIALIDNAVSNPQVGGGPTFVSDHDRHGHRRSLKLVSLTSTLVC